MGPVFVVMGHEHLEHTLKVFLVQNEQPVETFRADGPHEPFGYPIGLWGAERRANDFDPVTPEHVIKLVGELLIPITNQEANGFRAARQRPGQLASALDDPRRAGMRCASGQMHTTAAQLDEEEDVEPLQPQRFHRQEIDGQQAVPVCAHELAPGDPPTRARRPKARGPQPGPHRGRGDRYAQALQFAHNPL